MSLDIEIPKLDDKTFDDLVNELRLRIPRYAPEWTDFNESDPGMTLVQLFAWLSEMLQYRLNQVPERNYLKFLQLLGLELNPALPALAHLTFQVKENAQANPVPHNTRIQAQPSSGGDPLIFETEKGLDLIRFILQEVQVFDGTAFSKLTEANQAEDTTFRPLGWIPQANSALYLGFSPGTLNIEGRLFPRQMCFRVFLPFTAQDCAEQNCREAKHPPAPPISLVWEYRPSVDTHYWKRLNLFKDETAAFTREGYILVEGPKEMQSTQEGKVDEPLYWIRCRLVTGSYRSGHYPEIDFIRPNTVPARNLITIHEELVGTSEGHPRQSFILARRPVLRDSLVLVVEEPDGTNREWKRRDDFLASGKTDLHYVLNHNTGEIGFGDGKRGLIPPAGAEIVARKYCYGGGASGNLPKHQIGTPLTHLQGVEKVVNERRAEGGRDEEKIAELKKRAPAILRSRNCAVTSQDFAAKAAEAGGVLKATAIPLMHPDHPGIDVPGAVTVVIVPDTKDVPPIPSSELIRQTCNYLDQFRLVTTEVYVKKPEYLDVKLELRLVAERYAALDAVAEKVIKALNDSEYLNPKEQEFGRDIYPSRFYDVILDIKDIRSVESLNVYVKGRLQPLNKKIEVPSDGLLYAVNHEIVVVPATE